MYTFTIEAYIRHLKNLKSILEKAKVWQESKKISDEAMLNARLALDQFPFARQVRGTCMFATNSGAELCGIESLEFPEVEKNISDLQETIDKSISFLSKITPEMIKSDLETRMVPISWMPGKGFTAKHYIEVYAHFNFYFHYTTAYSILRHYGLDIGKADYMGEIDLLELK